VYNVRWTGGEFYRDGAAVRATAGGRGFVLPTHHRTTASPQRLSAERHRHWYVIIRYYYCYCYCCCCCCCCCCSQNVIVTKRGMWKLSGLCFTQTIGADLPSNVRTVKRQVPRTVSRRTHTRLLCLLTYFSAYLFTLAPLKLRPYGAIQICLLLLLLLLFASPGARTSGSIVVAVCSYFRLESRVWICEHLS